MITCKKDRCDKGVIGCDRNTFVETVNMKIRSHMEKYETKEADIRLALWMDGSDFDSTQNKPTDILGQVNISDDDQIDVVWDNFLNYVRIGSLDTRIYLSVIDANEETPPEDYCILALCGLAED